MGKPVVSDSRGVSMWDMEEKWLLVGSDFLDYFWIDGFVYYSKGWDPGWDCFTLKEYNLQSVGIFLPLYGDVGDHIQECETDCGQILQIVWYDWIAK